MGKGIIISGGDEGLYTATSLFNKDNYTAEIARLNSRIISLATQISEAEDGLAKNVLKVEKLGCEKRKKYLESNMPSDENISIWCADLTTDLSGDVGLIEVPGESVSFNIQPGYEGNALYNLARDGQLVPTVIQTPAQAYYNLAMLPGWQMWKPTFRYATITSIDGDTANLSLETAQSTQQSLPINQSSTLSDVPIEYMECDGFAFEAGDSVLVKFEGQSWDNPKVIGFKDNPKGCVDQYILIRHTNTINPIPGTTVPDYDFCWVWNPITDKEARIFTDATELNLVLFPCEYSDLAYFLSTHAVIIPGQVKTTATGFSVNPTYSGDYFVSPGELYEEEYSCGGVLHENYEYLYYPTGSVDPNNKNIDGVYEADSGWCYLGVDLDFYTLLSKATVNHRSLISTGFDGVGAPGTNTFTVDKTEIYTLSLPWGKSVDSFTEFQEVLNVQERTVQGGAITCTATNSNEDRITDVPLLLSYGVFVVSDKVYIGFGAMNYSTQIHSFDGACLAGVVTSIPIGTITKQPWKEIHDFGLYYDKDGTADTDSETPSKAISSDGLNTIFKYVMDYWRDNGWGDSENYAPIGQDPTAMLTIEIYEPAEQD